MVTGVEFPCVRVLSVFLRQKQRTLRQCHPPSTGTAERTSAFAREWGRLDGLLAESGSICATYVVPIADEPEA